MRRRNRLIGSFVLTGAGLTLLATPAGAHVSPDKDEVPNDSFNTVTLSVGHGCEDSPTTDLVVHVPEGLTNVKPQVKPGWDIEIVEEELDEPLEGPYGEVTEQITELVFTAEEGNELLDEHRDTFTLGFRTTFTEAGDYLFFKTVQTCEEGEHAWIEEYIEGVTEGEEPEEPSPVLLVTESEDGETTEATTADAEPASSSDDSSSSDDATGIAVAGLVVGALGLGAGGTALFRTRSSGS